MKLMNDIDYVVLYATKLKNNNALFDQQKMLIESQLQCSDSIFVNLFKNTNFKKSAEEYLRSVELI